MFLIINSNLGCKYYSVSLNLLYSINWKDKSYIIIQKKIKIVKLFFRIKMTRREGHSFIILSNQHLTSITCIYSLKSFKVMCYSICLILLDTRYFCPHILHLLNFLSGPDKSISKKVLNFGL